MGVEIHDNLRLAPVAWANLQIQLSIAEALHAHRLPLLVATRGARQERGWRKYIAALASHYATEVRQHNLSTPADVSLVLDGWRASGLVKKGPVQISGVVNDICAAAQAAAERGASAVQWLSAANDRAHAGVSTLLAREQIEHDLGDVPAELSVIPAAAGDPCASSSPMLGSVIWHFEATARGLWGALQAEMILRHEYLSHLAPRHPSLSSNVREGWLMEVLLEEIRSQFPEGHQFDGPALDDFREELMGGGSDRGVHDLAVRIRALNDGVYWGCTSAMVSSTREDLPDAAVFDRVLLRLMDEVPTVVLRNRIALCHWSGLQAFVDEVAGWI